jgi:hypothetical protein
MKRIGSSRTEPSRGNTVWLKQKQNRAGVRFGFDPRFVELSGFEPNPRNREQKYVSKFMSIGSIFSSSCSAWSQLQDEQKSSRSDQNSLIFVWICEEKWWGLRRMSWQELVLATVLATEPGTPVRVWNRSKLGLVIISDSKPKTRPAGFNFRSHMSGFFKFDTIQIIIYKPAISILVVRSFKCLIKGNGKFKMWISVVLMFCWYLLLNLDALLEHDCFSIKCHFKQFEYNVFCNCILQESGTAAIAMNNTSVKDDHVFIINWHIDKY